MLTEYVDIRTDRPLLKGIMELVSYGLHFASKLWADLSFKRLTIHLKAHMKESWVDKVRAIYQDAKNNGEAWVLLVDHTAMLVVLELPVKNVDPHLVDVSVDRWFPETDIFHMPFGQITITLRDVHTLRYPDRRRLHVLDVGGSDFGLCRSRVL